MTIQIIYRIILADETAPTEAGLTKEFLNMEDLHKAAELHNLISYEVMSVTKYTL